MIILSDAGTPGKANFLRILLDLYGLDVVMPGLASGLGQDRPDAVDQHVDCNVV